MLVTENSVIHVDRSEKSVIHIDWTARVSTYVDDGIFQRPHVGLLLHAWFFKTVLSIYSVN
jgi:hypothetical protein